LAPDVVEGADVRMVQGGDGARFALEALTRLPVDGKVWRQHLDRDLAAKARVLGAVDLAHASGAHAPFDSTRTDPSSFAVGPDSFDGQRPFEEACRRLVRRQQLFDLITYPLVSNTCVGEKLLACLRRERGSTLEDVTHARPLVGTDAHQGNRSGDFRLVLW